jgi:CrcB protein
MHWLKQRTISAGCVFCGSVAGGGLRFALQEGSVLWLGLAWLPATTIGINIIASAALGFVIAQTHVPRPTHKRVDYQAQRRLFWGTGFCGGFSSFSLFTVDWLMLASHPLVAFFYVIGSVLVALLGFRLAGHLMANSE